jgi:hypothetical protein
MQATASNPGPPSNGPSASTPARRPTWGISVFNAPPDASPTFRKLRDMLARGDYAETVRLAYRSAIEDTVRAYGLAVPTSITGPQFLKEFLRQDMGPLLELLPQLYRLYEPVRFGKHVNGDPKELLTLLEKLYSQTTLAVAHDPHYQSSSSQPAHRPQSPAESPRRTLSREEPS